VRIRAESYRTSVALGPLVVRVRYLAAIERADAVWPQLSKAVIVETLAFGGRSDMACAGADFPPNVEIGRVGTHARRKFRPIIVVRHGQPKRLRNRCEDHQGSRQDKQVAALS
jgi:hypothetical protein